MSIPIYDITKAKLDLDIIDDFYQDVNNFLEKGNYDMDFNNLIYYGLKTVQNSIQGLENFIELAEDQSNDIIEPQSNSVQEPTPAAQTYTSKYGHTLSLDAINQIDIELYHELVERNVYSEEQAITDIDIQTTTTNHFLSRVIGGKSFDTTVEYLRLHPEKTNIHIIVKNEDTENETWYFYQTDPF